MGKGKGVAKDRSYNSGADKLSEEGKALISALGDLAFNNRGVKIHEPSKMVLPDGTVADKFLAKAITEMAAAHKQAQAFKKRGGHYEYLPAGSSYDTVASKAIKGKHVLSVIDPPYYATKGYNGEKKVGIDTYNKTRLLIDRVVKDGNSLIYTDEAWFDKAISQIKKDKKTGATTYGPDHGKTAIPKDIHKNVDGLDAKGQLLAIRNGIDALFRTAELKP